MAGKMKTTTKKKKTPTKTTVTKKGSYEHGPKRTTKKRST